MTRKGVPDGVTPMSRAATTFRWSSSAATCASRAKRASAWRSATVVNVLSASRRLSVRRSIWRARNQIQFWLRARFISLASFSRICAVSSPHSTVFVGPGETRTAVATCPRGNKLLAGGFQRTNFVTRGGNYVTESRASSDRSWQVSGSAFGNFGGELTAIAYCLKSGGALVSEVDSQTELPVEQSATTTTPACPPGSNMVAGGFSTSPSGPALVSSAYFNPTGGWSATAFNEFGPDATVSAYGYCMTNAMIKRRAKMRHGTRAQHERTIKAPPILDSALKVAISERVSNNGCFPSPGGLVAALQANKIDARQAASPRAVSGGVVNVLTDQASSERVRLAVRRGRAVIVLDSATGAVTKRRLK